MIVWSLLRKDILWVDLTDFWMGLTEIKWVSAREYREKNTLLTLLTAEKQEDLWHTGANLIKLCNLQVSLLFSDYKTPATLVNY